MIRYSLICDKEHEFDGWFSTSEDFDKQRQRGLVACPTCHSVKVSKSLMAPQVRTSRQKEALQVTQASATHAELLAKVRELRAAIEANSVDVGKGFAEEARKIHYGEVEERLIRGEASHSEVEELLEEGIGVLPIPSLPSDAN